MFPFGISDDFCLRTEWTRNIWLKNALGRTKSIEILGDAGRGPEDQYKRPQRVGLTKDTGLSFYGVFS